MLSDEFAQEIEDRSTIRQYWKDYYQYSSNDERYLTATDSQVLSDYLQLKIKGFKDKYPDPFILKTARNRALNPRYDDEINSQFKLALQHIERVDL